MSLMNVGVIDTHTHAFPDALAQRVIPQLAASAEWPPALDGTIASLLASMDRAGIEQSWLCSIATAPEQFDPILKWSLAIRSPRIVPLGSVHPDDPDPAARVRQIAAAGLPGLKLHPFYQQFEIDEPRMDPIWAAMEACDLFAVCHAGFDPAFPRERRAAPERIRRVIERFPRLRFIAAHLGGWQDWDAVREHLLGEPVWLDLSCTLHLLDREAARDLLLAHPPTRLLFGSDSPWMDQLESLAALRALELPPALERAILRDNARALLG